MVHIIVEYHIIHIIVDYHIIILKWFACTCLQDTGWLALYKFGYWYDINKCQPRHSKVSGPNLVICLKHHLHKSGVWFDVDLRIDIKIKHI